MKVGVTGSHGSGKSCLTHGAAELILRANSQVTVIPEVARRVIAMGLPLNADARLESYFRYVQFQLEAERQATGNVLSDRTLVDLLAYVEVNSDPNIPSEFVDMLREVVQRETQFYDYHCHLPLEFALELDGVRPADQDYQKAVDTQVLEILSRYKLPYFTVTGSLERRCEVLTAVFLGRSSLSEDA